MIHSKLGYENYPLAVLTTKLLLLKTFRFDRTFIKIIFTKLITDIYIIVDNPGIFFPFNQDEELVRKSINKTLI